MNPIALLRRHVKAHHFGRAGLVAAGIVAALLFFVIGTGIRLLIGPVSLGPFAGSLASAIDRALPGVTVKYDQAAVEWERDVGQINLVIIGTRVFDRDGRIIAQAPKADIDIAAGPFLHGKIEIKRIILVGVQLTMVRTADGGLRLGIGKDSQEQDILKRIQDALKNSQGPSTLETFAVRRARLAFYDESTKLFVVAPHADFRLTRQGEGLAAAVNADVEISGFPAHVSGDIAFPAGHGPVTGRLAIAGLSLHSLAANSSAFAAVKNTALKVDVATLFTIDGPKLTKADFGAVGEGTLQVPEIKNGAVHISRLFAKGHYDGVGHKIVLDEASVISDKIKAELKGRLGFAVDTAGDVSGLSGELHIRHLGLAWPDVFAGPVDFETVDVKGEWQRAARQFVVEKLTVGGAPFGLQASGQITFADNQSPAVDVKGSFATITVHELVRYWPLGAAEGGRKWVDANMPSGIVGPTTFEIHFTPGMLDAPALPPEAIAVKFAINKGELSYIKGLTNMTEVSGTGVVTGTSLKADVATARIGPLSVRDARFEIPDFNAAEESGIVTARVQGAMPDVLALVDMGPLRYPTRFGINAASSKGDTTLDLTVKIPLLRSVTVDHIGIGIKAQVNGFALTFGKSTQLTDGAVNFVIDNNRLRATGTAGLGGSASRLALDWTEEFTTAKGPVTTRVALKGAIDDTARTTLGIGLKDYFKGAIGVSGTLTGHRGALNQANLTLDLTPIVVTLNLIGVNKPAGFPMTARLAATFGPGSALDTAAIRITGQGTAVTATAKFEGGHLAQLQAPSVRIGSQNDFALTLTRGSSGSDIQIRGRSLDGSRIGAESSGGDDKFDEPFHISARLDRLGLRDGATLSNIALEATGVGDRPATLSLSGTISKTGTLAMAVTPGDGGRRLTLTVSDMGLLLQGLYGFTSIKGGKLDMAATLNGRADQPVSGDGPDFQGKATLRDFRVLNQPFLARLFTAGSLGGLANLLQGQGVQVDSLDVPFSSKNSVISVHDLRATGPAIGISADGYIDRPKNAIALKGSLVPLFGLNSVLGNIPLLGTLVTSKQGEGIIGMTYSVTGNADEPSVSVNPLSALAPGILRRIFEGKMPTAPVAPPNATPPPAPKTATPAAPPPAAAPPMPKPKPKQGESKSGHDGD